jgi:hypothetical protein
METEREPVALFRTIHVVPDLRKLRARMIRDLPCRTGEGARDVRQGRPVAGNTNQGEILLYSCGRA